jgi:hypothetical protein
MANLASFGSLSRRDNKKVARGKQRAAPGSRGKQRAASGASKPH